MTEETMNRKYYSLAVDQGDRTADLYIFGDITDSFNTGFDDALGWELGETSGLSIAKDIESLDVDELNVHINSNGGYTSEGLAIYNLLRNCKAKVTTYCDGFACSAASVIFMAGERRVMGAASMLMIHNAWVGTAGNSAQLREEADRLEKISKAAANAYMEHVTIDEDELDRLLDGESHEGTWILPEEAVEMGFATEIAEQDTSDVANQSVVPEIMELVKSRSAAQHDTADDRKITIAVDVDTAAASKKISGLIAEMKAAEEMGERIFGNFGKAQAQTNRKPKTLAEQMFGMKK